MTEEEKQELERLRQENELLKSQLTRGLRLKVSAKGGVSVYGLQRMPITLYKNQWLRLLDMAPEIRTFLKEHLNELSEKGDSSTHDRESN